MLLNQLALDYVFIFRLFHSKEFATFTSSSSSLDRETRYTLSQGRKLLCKKRETPKNVINKLIIHWRWYPHMNFVWPNWKKLGKWIWFPLFSVYGNWHACMNNSIKFSPALNFSLETHFSANLYANIHIGWAGHKAIASNRK